MEEQEREGGWPGEGGQRREVLGPRRPSPRREARSRGTSSRWRQEKTRIHHTLNEAHFIIWSAENFLYAEELLPGCQTL